MLILDFDGVICDAFTECALITWFGAHPYPESANTNQLVGQLPDVFLVRFRAVRNYSRQLEHFVVALYPEADSISDQESFDGFFAGLHTAAVARFAQQAASARARLRGEHAAFWFELHSIYPGIQDLFERHHGRIAIVTAKDARSVDCILQYWAMRDAVWTVLGECTNKAQGVVELCNARAITPESAVFIDDSLPNVLRVRETGARTLWARWGYHTSDHVRQGQAAAVNSVTLGELPLIQA